MAIGSYHVLSGYDNYAVEAFDVGALDYLMKPITQQRIAKTLEKMSRRHHRPAVTSDTDMNRLGQEILTEQETKVLQLISAGLSN